MPSHLSQTQMATNIFDHNSKATILWKAFKDRLGRSEFNYTNHNLADFLKAHHDIP